MSFIVNSFVVALCIASIWSLPIEELKSELTPPPAGVLHINSPNGTLVVSDLFHPAAAAAPTPVVEQKRPARSPIEMPPFEIKEKEHERLEQLRHERHEFLIHESE